MDFFRTQIIKKCVECELTLNALFQRTQLKLALFQWQLKIASSAHKLFEPKKSNSGGCVSAERFLFAREGTR